MASLTAVSSLTGRLATGGGWVRVPGHVAHGLQIFGAGVDQIGLRLALIGDTLGQRGLGLGEVRVRRDADGELSLGLVQGFLQHLDVADREVEQGLVAHDVEMGGGRLKQHRLLDIQQIGPLGAHLVFGLGDGGVGPSARPDRLGDPDRNVARLEAAAAQHGRIRVLIGDADIALAGYRRAAQRQGLGQVFVNDPKLGPLGGQRRIGGIGLDHRVFDAVGPGIQQWQKDQGRPQKQFGAHG